MLIFIHPSIRLSIRPFILPSIHTHPQLLPHLPVSISTLKLPVFLLVLPFLIRSSAFSPAFPICLSIPPRQQRNRLPTFLPGLYEPLTLPTHFLRTPGTMSSMPGGEGKKDGKEVLSCFLSVFVFVFSFLN